MDYNDQKDCAEVLGQLIELSGKWHTHICSCLHTNKDGRTERGVLGAMYKQKAETTMLLKGYEEFTVVAPAEGGCRQEPFRSFCFGLTKGIALPVVWEGDTAVAEQESVLQRAERYASTVFRNQIKRELSYSELTNGIFKEAEKESQEGLSERNVYRLIKMMVDTKFLDKPRRGFYSLHEDDDDEPAQDELPFDLPEQEDQENTEDGTSQDGYDDGLPY